LLQIPHIYADFFSQSCPVLHRIAFPVVSRVPKLRVAGSFALDALCALENQQNPGSDSLSLPGNAASPLASRESTNCGQGKLHLKPYKDSSPP
jgi:hypothetical protein